MQYLGIMGVGLFKESEPVYFGTFGDALFTMLQMLTFDSWASLIARKRIHEDGIAAAIYFVSFIFIGGIIMLNVVVAVLLEKFLDGTGRLKILFKANEKVMVLNLRIFSSAKPTAFQKSGQTSN